MIRDDQPRRRTLRRTPAPTVSLFMCAAAIAFQPIPQVALLAISWLLPDLVPSEWPLTPQRKRAWQRYQRSAVLFVFLAVVVNGIFGGGPRLESPAGGLSVEGMMFGLRTSLRLLLLATAGILAIAPLAPLELADRLTRMRLSRGIPMAVLLSIRLVEELPLNIRKVRDAQASRGVPVDGSLSQRISSLRLLVTPLVLRSLSAAVDRAVALHVRGLTEPPIWEETSPVSGARHHLATGILAASVLLFLYGIFAWLNFFPLIG